MPILIGVKCCLIGLICGSLSRVRLNIFSSIGFSSGFLPCKFPADIICPSFCYILCWLFQIYMLHIYLLSVCSLSVHFAYVFWEQLMLLNLFYFFFLWRKFTSIFMSHIGLNLFYTIFCIKWYIPYIRSLVLLLFFLFSWNIWDNLFFECLVKFTCKTVWV